MADWFVADEELEEKIGQLRGLRADAADYSKQAQALRAEILQLIGESPQVVTASGVALATAATVTTRKINSRKLQAKYPDVYEDVLEESTYTTLNLEGE